MKRIFTLLAFILLFLLSFLPSHLYADLADIIVDHSPANVSNLQVVTDGNGHVYVVWEDIRNGSSDIYFNYSSDYGLTWQSSDIRLDTDAPGASHSRSPQITCDNNGHVYVVWEDERNGSSDIYFNFSSDHGASWQGTDIRLNTAPFAPPAQFPKIACDNNGRVYVAWDDNYFNTSADFGATWLNETIRISTSGGIGTQLTSDQNGHVYVAWRTSDVMFNYSSDYGNTWQTLDRVLSNTGAIPYGFSLASDEIGHVYVTWHDGRNNPNSPDIYFNSSSDYGDTWVASDIRINTGTAGATYSIWPEVTCDETGHVYVTWYDRRNGLGDIYLNFSSDYGTNWQISDIRLDTDSPGTVDSGYPNIATNDSGHVYVIWNDNQTDIGSGLYLNYSLDYGTTWLSENMKIGSSGFNPQIVTDASSSYIVKDNNDILFNYITPFLPIEPTPINGAEQVSLNPTLSWHGGNLNLDDTLTYDVYFDTSSPPTTLVSPNQPGRTYTPVTLSYFTTYYWKIVARDSSGTETAGPIWSFKTISNPPQFVDFSPPDGATGVGLTPTLSWTATDPNPGDTISYDVYFGTANPPPRVTTDQTSNTYNPGQLNHLTVYYWKIVARDNNGSEAEGPILSFTTLNNPPQFIGYLPSDGSTGVSLTPTLKWFATDPDRDTVTYDIYFGTSSPPSLILSNQTITTYQTGQLNHFTVYYWKIVARDSLGAETESPVLSFTTLSNPPVFLDFIPFHGSTGVSITPTLSWSASDPDPDDTLTYDIYFGTSSPPPLKLSNQTAMSYQPGELVYSTIYYWKIVARDNHGAETSSSIKSFLTVNRAPEFSSFSPEDGATKVSLKPTLSWTASDPDPGDTIIYNIYFGTSSKPPLVATKYNPTYKPGELNSLTTYYWKIVAIDNHDDQTVGPLLSFTTTSKPPIFVSFTPANSSKGVSITPTLSWFAYDEDPGDKITYDVYLGTSSDPPLVSANQIAQTYKPAEELLPATTYYWKVVARDNHGDEKVGPALTFSTANKLIDYISPNPCKTRKIISIIGNHFGVTQGDSEIHLGAKVFGPGSTRIIMWSDTRIDFKVPAYTAWPSGTIKTIKLWLRVNGFDSNKIPLKIKKP